ncbi:LysM peptidoglycan-binding domain-containing protein [Tropicimonas isoalkanivorans]|uniref:LysM domain-containing protein n=1 Tax=Tropicimonas isoalkanivorans TaxID=441112 RepID=A0A1I1G102_9RHOB|nr:LysM peptidoglycan-binding domain-containing protein [Tropicimonas isoalkanivorans]SFC05181.1 LysM domain-containing protein [Tropicimonas isoalkanivorans]
MSEKAGLGRAGGIAAVAVVAAAGLIVFLGLRSQDVSLFPAAFSPGEEASGPTGPAEQAPKEQTLLANEPDGAARESATTTAPDAGQPASGALVFDHVRVDPDGRTVIAGKAPGGFDVSIEVDGADIQTVSTDSSGHFAAFVELPTTDAARVISLVARHDGEEVRSENSVILAPHMAGETAAGGVDIAIGDAAGGGTAPEDAEGAAVALARSGSVASQGTTTDGTETPDGQRASEPAANSPDGAKAPAVLLAKSDGVEMLHSANSVPARLRDRVVVDVISYSDDGSVTLEGRAAANFERAGTVQVYLDNELVQSIQRASDGSWRMLLPQVKAGVYTLRVDQVGADGRVVARFETPFKREDPTELARLAPAGGTSGPVSASVITVQPGYTLWGIANDRYGDGLEYVQIFEANKGQIRNPDLIYPGQVFELPGSGDGDGATIVVTE